MPEHPHRQPEFRGDDRAQTISARQAAEALFKPKPAVSEPSVFASAESVKARIPRVLPALPPATIRRETVDTPAVLEQSTAPVVPVKKLVRLRTLLKYGMTVSQLADLYSVPERRSSASEKSEAELAPNGRPQSDAAPAYLVDVAVPGPGNARMREKRSGQVARMPGVPLLVDR